MATILSAVTYNSFLALSGIELIKRKYSLDFILSTSSIRSVLMYNSLEIIKSVPTLIVFNVSSTKLIQKRVS